MQNERMRIYPEFKIFNCAFYEYNGSPFFVKFVTEIYLLNFVKFLGNNIMLAYPNLSY